MNRHAWVLGAVMLASFSAALVGEEGTNRQFYLEQSQDAVRQQQAFSGRVEAVPEVEGRIEAPRREANPEADASAARTIQLQDERQQSRQNLIKAEKQLTEAPKKGGFDWMGLLIIMTGLGLVFGAMKWADKALPAMPTRKKVNW